MVYALPRKLRTSDGHDLSYEPEKSSPISKVERAQELQSVLEASFRGTRSTHDTHTPPNAASVDGTPRRRRVPHAFANPVPPVNSTPLTPRRALRPYPEFPAANWSASQVGSTEKVGRPLSTREPLRSVHPMSILEEDQLSSITPASSSSSAIPNGQRTLQSKPMQGVPTKAHNSFMPQRRPAVEVAQVDSSHILQQPLSPASSTDDPLLIHDPLMSNISLHAAQGDSDLVAMVRQFEHEDLAQLPSPSTNAPHSASQRRANSRTSTPFTPPIHARSLHRSSLSTRQTTPDTHQLQATPTPARYDRSLGLRERIALLKSPSKASAESTPISSRRFASKEPSVVTDQHSVPIAASSEQGNQQVGINARNSNHSTPLRSVNVNLDQANDSRSLTPDSTAQAQHPTNSVASAHSSSRRPSQFSPRSESRHWQSQEQQQTPARPNQSTRTRQSVSSVGLLPWGAGSPTREVTPRSTFKTKTSKRSKFRGIEQDEGRAHAQIGQDSLSDSKSVRSRTSSADHRDNERALRDASAVDVGGEDPGLGRYDRQSRNSSRNHDQSSGQAAQVQRSQVDDVDLNDETEKNADHRRVSDEHDKHDANDANYRHQTNDEHDGIDDRDARDAHNVNDKNVHFDTTHRRLPDEHDKYDANHRLSDELDTDRHELNEHGGLLRLSEELANANADSRSSKDRKESRDDHTADTKPSQPNQLRESSKPSKPSKLDEPRQPQDDTDLYRGYPRYLSNPKEYGTISTGKESRKQNLQDSHDARLVIQHKKDSAKKRTGNDTLEELRMVTERNSPVHHHNEPDSELDAFVFERVAPESSLQANPSVSAEFSPIDEPATAAVDFPFERVSLENQSLPISQAARGFDRDSVLDRSRGDRDYDPRALQTAAREEHYDSQDDDQNEGQDHDHSGEIDDVQDWNVEEVDVQEEERDDDHYVGMQEKNNDDQNASDQDFAMEEELIEDQQLDDQGLEIEQEQEIEQEVDMEGIDGMADRSQARIINDERIHDQEVFSDHRVPIQGDDDQQGLYVDEQGADERQSDEQDFDDEGPIVDEQGFDVEDDGVDEHGIDDEDPIDDELDVGDEILDVSNHDNDDEVLIDDELDVDDQYSDRSNGNGGIRANNTIQATNVFDATDAADAPIATDHPKQRILSTSRATPDEWDFDEDLFEQLERDLTAVEEAHRSVEAPSRSTTNPTQEDWHRQKTRSLAMEFSAHRTEDSSFHLQDQSQLDDFRWVKEADDLRSKIHTPYRKEKVTALPSSEHKRPRSVSPVKVQPARVSPRPLPLKTNWSPSGLNSAHSLKLPNDSVSARNVNRNTTRLPIPMSRLRTAYVKDAEDDMRDTIMIGDEDVSANASTVVMEDESESRNADSQQAMHSLAHVDDEPALISIATSPSKRRRIDPESVRDTFAKPSPAKPPLPVRQPSPAKQATPAKQPSQAQRSNQEPELHGKFQHSSPSRRPWLSKNISQEPNERSSSQIINQEHSIDHDHDHLPETSQGSTWELHSRSNARPRSSHYTPTESVANQHSSSTPSKSKTCLQTTPRLPSPLAQDLLSFTARVPSPEDWELTPPPLLSSPKVGSQEPLHDSLADLSASLSASSYARARMLARSRPTACVEIASLDPHAAARAAAILRVHHQYIQEGWLRQQAADSLDIEDQQLESSSGNTHLPALLSAAEYGERNESKIMPPSTPYLPGAFPPRSARKSSAPTLSAPALRPQARAGKWSEFAWSELDRHLQMELYRVMEQNPQQTYREAIMNLDVDGILDGFLNAEALELDDLQGDWSLSRLRARIPALQLRLLRKWDQLAGVDSEEQTSATLRRKSISALANNSAMEDGLISGNAQMFARDPDSEKANCSEPTVNAIDITQGILATPTTEAPSRSETSFVSQILSKVWPRKSTGTKHTPTSDHLESSKEKMSTKSSNHADSSNVTQQDKSHASFSTSTQAPARNWPSRNGTSSVQSTAFSALGAQAQQQATTTAQRLAQDRAKHWQSPREQRRNRRSDQDVGKGAPRAAYVAARNRFLDPRS